jgi:hypothetical protein
MNDNQLACIDVLRDALREAEAGNVSACAVVLCMTGGWASVVAGERAGDLNLGCDDVKKKILNAVVNNASLNQKKANILRVK